MDRWCGRAGLARGETISLDQCWRLAKAWYADRLEPGWRRKTPEEAQAVFAEIGLMSDFWRLRS